MYEKYRDLIKTAATAGLSLMSLIDQIERLWLYYNNWHEDEDESYIEQHDEDQFEDDKPE